jgi:ATPase family protein associated with various cellular activities (AAA)
MIADEPVRAPAMRLQDVALTAAEEICGPGQAAASSQEDHFLRHTAGVVRAHGRSLNQALGECLLTPAPGDERLVWLAGELRLSRLEILAVALAAAVEDSPLVGRVLAHVQRPVGGSRPTLGLLASSFERAFEPTAALVPTLLNGPALKTGLLCLLNDTAPLPERPVMVPAPLCLALAGHDSLWSGTTIGMEETATVPLPDSVRAQAARHAAALEGEARRGLALRTGSPAEGRSVALTIAGALNRRPVFIETDKVAGFGPWLLLRRLLPVFCQELAPAERRRLPGIIGYDGPVLVVCGPEGSIEMSQGSVTSWSLPIPSRDGRRALWLAALGRPVGSRSDPDREAIELADQLASEHRHGTGRIAHLGRLAHHHAALAGRPTVNRSDVLAAAWTGEGGGLDALAEPLRASVSDEALVASTILRADLDALLLRCRGREDLADGLGASASTRYRPGVRTLFTGPSGTGKTLAAGWIATKLGLPLYRVDLASVTSKYIGETEKNLSQLLARAEQAEVILLFDEADALFGKRTEINDANDRFANAQTNYLLQRIENYDGVVILTSNSQARFDGAFARRLDFIIDFPLPGPDERRALWQSHLGPQTKVTASELNQLAVLVDLNGGQTRNVVLAAAVHARRARREIEFADLLSGIGAELRKLGRQVPLDLQSSR